MSNGAGRQGGALDGPVQGDLWARRSVIRSCPFVLLRPGEAEESGPGGEGCSWAENTLRLLPILRRFTLSFATVFGAATAGRCEIWQEPWRLLFFFPVFVFVRQRNALMCWSVAFTWRPGQDRTSVYLAVHQRRVKSILPAHHTDPRVICLSLYRRECSVN